MKNMINKDSILINTSKGIEQSSMKPIFSIFKDVLPRVSKRYVTISGPSFAYDVASGLPTSVTLAASNSLLLPVAMKIFENQNFKTYTSKDIVGVELGGSLKNVIAIGAGILDGMIVADDFDSYLTIKASAKDENDSDNVIPGFTEGAEISYRFGIQVNCLKF